MKIEEAKARFFKALIDAEREKWTLTNYSGIINRLVKVFPEAEVEDLKAKDIEDFLDSLEIGQASRQQYKLRLRPFFKWLVGTDIIPRNPMDGIIMAKVVRRKIAENDWLTLEECDKIKSVCNIGEKATFVLGIKSGCRKETLTSPDTKFDLEHHRLTTFEKRHREGINYYFNGEATESLKKYFEYGEKWPYVDDKNIGAMLAKLGRKAGIQKKITAKMLRHTFACHSRLKGMKREDLQGLLHHANPQTTAIYDDIGPSELQKIQEKVWGQ